jgi:hypothetical protein
MADQTQIIKRHMAPVTAAIMIAVLCDVAVVLKPGGVASAIGGFIAMPGLIVGLFMGYVVANRELGTVIVMFSVSILLNSAIYYFAYRFVAWAFRN